MGSKKDQDLKDFLISERRKTSAGMTSAPVWILQKAGKRIWNKKQKRHWSQTDFGNAFRKKKRGEKK